MNINRENKGGIAVSKICVFDKKGKCWALACYSSAVCGARDEKGNPKYVTLGRIKEKDKK